MVAENPRPTPSVPVAGFCVVRWEMERGRRIGHIITIDVAPELRREGIGRALMEAGESALTQQECVAFTLEVAVDNPGAQAFYRSFGYEGTDRLRGYYADGTDALVMRKELRPPA